MKLKTSVSATSGPLLLFFSSRTLRVEAKVARHVFAAGAGVERGRRREGGEEGRGVSIRKALALRPHAHSASPHRLTCNSHTRHAHLSYAQRHEVAPQLLVVTLHPGQLLDLGVGQAVHAVEQAQDDRLGVWVVWCVCCSGSNQGCRKEGRAAGNARTRTGLKQLGLPAKRRSNHAAEPGPKLTGGCRAP